MSKIRSARFSDRTFCTIWKYSRGHNHLKILVSDSEEQAPYFLMFSDVQYLSGPFAWHATFMKAGSKEELNNLMKGSLWAHDDDLGELDLFTIGTDELRVHIVAKEVMLIPSHHQNGD